MPKQYTDETSKSSIITSKEIEVIELEAVEIPRQRPSVHDIDEESSNHSSGYSQYDRQNQGRTPPFVFKTSQNLGCNCCVFWIFVMLFLLFTIF